MNAIEVRGVTKSFGALAVLKGIDLTVAQGEVFTLLGANGAGKSTLIDILTTLSRADAGTVRIMGLDPVRDGRRVRTLISLNAQAATVDEAFTGAANLRLIAQLRGVNDIDAAVSTLAAQLGLTPFLARKVQTYSGGMRRRLDLAMSLLGDPAVIFLDEPTTGVDPKNRLALWAMIRALRTAGKTVFLTTQNLEEADALSDHIAFIHEGTIVKNGTPEAIKQRVVATYTIRVAAGQTAAAAAALTAAQLAFTQDHDRLSVAAAGAAQALAALLAQGLTVQHYDRDEADLETVFLNVTAEEADHAHA